ncbi:MAG: gfo/Idh/MocA family oxidoreductase [Chloroflexi bacterium]|nr:gfo/Idh/MocA family oxidoreductase [Chloroflexota bacterium]
MKFLIAGFGSIGRRHFQNLKSLDQHDILFYRSGKSRLPEQERDLEGFIVETDLEAALAHQPDAVIAANPTALHMDVAIPAARAGAHLLVEKPIAQSLDQMDELQQALAEGGGKFLMGFQFRFNPGLRLAKERLTSGALGAPLIARVHWGEYLPDWHPWEDYRKSYSARNDLGGGVVLTLCHPFDYLRWLLGEVRSVHGFTHNRGILEIEVEEQAEARLAFAGGVTGTVQLDYLQRPKAHWLEILCTDGYIQWDDTTGYVKLYDNATGQKEEIPPARDYERNQMFLAQTSHFLDMVTGKSDPLTTLEDGRRALEIALAVHDSAASGLRIDF